MSARTSNPPSLPASLGTSVVSISLFNVNDTSKKISSDIYASLTGQNLDPDDSTTTQEHRSPYWRWHDSKISTHLPSFLLLFYPLYRLAAARHFSKPPLRIHILDYNKNNTCSDTMPLSSVKLTKSFTLSHVIASFVGMLPHDLHNIV